MAEINYNELARGSLMRLKDFYKVKVKVYEELVRRSQYFNAWTVSPEKMLAEIRELEVLISDSESATQDFSVKDSGNNNVYRKVYVQLEQTYVQQGRNLVNIALQINDIDLYKRPDQTDSYIAKLDLLDKIFDIYKNDTEQTSNNIPSTYCRDAACLGLCYGHCISSCSVSCSNGCATTCESDCELNCTQTCSNTCKENCQGKLEGKAIV